MTEQQGQTATIPETEMPEEKYITLETASKISGYTREYLERLCRTHKIHYRVWNNGQIVPELNSLLGATQAILVTHEGIVFIDKKELTDPTPQIVGDILSSAFEQAATKEGEGADIPARKIIQSIPRFGEEVADHGAEGGRVSYVGRAVFSDPEQKIEKIDTRNEPAFRTPGVSTPAPSSKSIPVVRERSEPPPPQNDIASPYRPIMTSVDVSEHHDPAPLFPPLVKHSEATLPTSGAVRITKPDESMESLNAPPKETPHHGAEHLVGPQPAVIRLPGVHAAAEHQPIHLRVTKIEHKVPLVKSASTLSGAPTRPTVSAPVDLSNSVVAQDDWDALILGDSRDVLPQQNPSQPEEVRAIQHELPEPKETVAPSPATLTPREKNRSLGDTQDLVGARARTTMPESTQEERRSPPVTGLAAALLAGTPTQTPVLQTPPSTGSTRAQNSYPSVDVVPKQERSSVPVVPPPQNLSSVAESSLVHLISRTPAPLARNLPATTEEHHLAKVEPRPLTTSIPFNLAIALLLVGTIAFILSGASFGSTIQYIAGVGAADPLPPSTVNGAAIPGVTGGDIDPGLMFPFSDEVVIVPGATKNSVLVQPVFRNSAGLVQQFRITPMDVTE
jgi:hypothetical protein